MGYSETSYVSHPRMSLLPNLSSPKPPTTPTHQCFLLKDFAHKYELYPEEKRSSLLPQRSSSSAQPSWLGEFPDPKTLFSAILESPTEEGGFFFSPSDPSSWIQSLSNPGSSDLNSKVIDPNLVQLVNRSAPRKLSGNKRKAEEKPSANQ